MSNSTESKRRALFCCHYARLGDVAEAARCAGYPPETAAAVQALDLFPVSSVKRDKNGGMEIHFFDRLKALTALYEYGGDADGKAAAHALLTALSGREAVDSDAED